MESKPLLSESGEKSDYLSQGLQKNAAKSGKAASLYSSVSVNEQKKPDDNVNTGPSWRRWRKNQVVPAIVLCAVGFAGVCICITDVVSLARLDYRLQVGCINISDSNNIQVVNSSWPILMFVVACKS